MNKANESIAKLAKQDVFDFETLRAFHEGAKEEIRDELCLLDLDVRESNWASALARLEIVEDLLGKAGLVKLELQTLQKENK